MVGQILQLEGSCRPCPSWIVTQVPQKWHSMVHQWRSLQPMAFQPITLTSDNSILPDNPGLSWICQNLAPVPTPDHTLPSAVGGGFLSQTDVSAPQLTSPRYTIPSAFQPLNAFKSSGRRRNHQPLASTQRRRSCPEQNQVLDSSALSTTREWPDLQRQPTQIELRNGSTLANVIQEPEDVQIFEFLDLQGCSQDAVDDFCEKQTSTRVA
jgi:hypothetical protein